MCVLTQLYPFSSLLILLLSSSSSYTERALVLSHILRSYLLNIFWRICASCHSPLIRFLICERHVVKFFCVWLMVFCCWRCLLPVLFCIIMQYGKNLLYSHTYLKLVIFNKAQGRSLSFLCCYETTSWQLCVREFPFPSRDLLVCLSSC